MKYWAICLLLAISAEASAYRLSQRSGVRMMDDSSNTMLDDDLDALMDKYDDKEKGKTAPKQAAASKPAAGGPSAAQITDMEYKILSGQPIVMASTKADEDDQIQEVLEKYASEKNGEKHLTKNDAQEAAIELMEQKGRAGTMD